MIQEFPSIKWSAADNSSLSAGCAPPPPGHTDAFGMAYDGGAWQGPRLLPSVQPRLALGPSQNPLSGGTVLITGGLGGLGLLFGQWAVNQGARGVCLHDVETASQPMLSTGDRPCSVAVVSGDISRRAESAGAWSAAVSCFGEPIRAVLHAAGVLQDALMLSQTPGSFRRVLAGKVAGVFGLEGAMKLSPLGLAALFSSVSSIVAPLGQPNYATANAMLNHWASTSSAQVPLDFSKNSTLLSYANFFHQTEWFFAPNIAIKRSEAGCCLFHFC